MRILLVLAGTAPSEALLRSHIADSELVIAADGGANIFSAYDLEPDVLIGDLDSIAKVEWSSCEKIRDPDQNTSDLEKVLNYLPDQGITHISILGGLGGRTDHLLTNLKLCSLIDPDIDVVFHNDRLNKDDLHLETLYRLTPTGLNIPMKLNSLVSISCLSKFSGLRTKGLKWELNRMNSDAGFFSQSNRAVSESVTFSLQDGIAYIAVYQ